MQIVYENTEKQLDNFIANIQDKPQSWRLISIEFQNSTTLDSPLFQNLCLQNIYRFFEQSDCKIFWMKPAFLMIFFQGRAAPIEKCVEGFLKETEFRGFGRFFDILDLSVHWPDFINFITRIKQSKTIDTKQVDKIILQESLPTKHFTIEITKERIEDQRYIRQSRTKPLILLVEDDPFTLQLVKLVFKDVYEIITAETARQALAYYQRHLPDIVFLDIQLPDGDGTDLLKKMTEADEDSYVVMLSSHSQKERILDCMNNKAKGFIAKPFTRQRLTDMTDKFFAARKNLDQGMNRHGT